MEMKEEELDWDVVIVPVGMGEGETVIDPERECVRDTEKLGEADRL